MSPMLSYLRSPARGAVQRERDLSSICSLPSLASRECRHRTTIENVPRDGKHGAALRRLPSGYPQVNKAWMWGAPLAACRRLIVAPGRLVRTRAAQSSGCRPAMAWSPTSSPSCGPLPRCPHHRPPPPGPRARKRRSGTTPGHPVCPQTPNRPLKSIFAREDQLTALLADSGRRTPINFCNRSRLAFSTGKWTKTVKAAS